MGDTNVTVIPQKRQVFYTTYALLPTSGVNTGDLGYATDTLMLYRWSGAAWQPITPDPTTMVKGSTGTYTGDDTDNRAIPHGLGQTPKFVGILCGTHNRWFAQIYDGYLYCMSSTPAIVFTPVNSMTPTNFYLRNGGANMANQAGETYRWIALG